jgi:hypothetical protein
MEATGSEGHYIYRAGNSRRSDTHAQGSRRSFAPCASRTCGCDHQQIQLLFLRSQLEVPGWYLWHPLTIVSVFDFETCEITFSDVSEEIEQMNFT